jgi:hypothetical protein
LHFFVNKTEPLIQPSKTFFGLKLVGGKNKTNLDQQNRQLLQNKRKEATKLFFSKLRNNEVGPKIESQ